MDDYATEICEKLRAKWSPDAGALTDTAALAEACQHLADIHGELHRAEEAIVAWRRRYHALERKFHAFVMAHKRKGCGLVVTEEDVDAWAMAQPDPLPTALFLTGLASRVAK